MKINMNFKIHAKKINENIFNLLQNISFQNMLHLLYVELGILLGIHNSIPYIPPKDLYLLSKGILRY